MPCTDSRSVVLGAELGEEAVASEIPKHIANLYYSRGNKASTVQGKLVAVQRFHRRLGIECPDEAHFVTKSVKAGISRESALKEEPQQMRRPISWAMLKHPDCLLFRSGEVEDGNVVEAGGFLFYLDRASEVFAYNE